MDIWAVSYLGILVTNASIYCNIPASCPAGEGQNPSDNGTCINCPIGTWSDADDISQCTSCTGGLTTNAEGSTSVNDCVGKYEYNHNKNIFLIKEHWT